MQTPVASLIAPSLGKKHALLPRTQPVIYTAPVCIMAARPPAPL